MSRGMCPGGSVCDQEGVCVLRTGVCVPGVSRGVCPGVCVQGVCLQGCVCPGGVCPGGVSRWVFVSRGVIHNKLFTKCI